MQSDSGRVCSDKLQEAFFGTRRTVGYDRDPVELDHLAATLEAYSKYGIRSQAECITYIRAMEGCLEHKYGGSASDQKPLDLLREAHAYITEHNLLSKTVAPAETAAKQGSGKFDREKMTASQQQKKLRQERTRDDRGKGARRWRFAFVTRTATWISSTRLRSPSQSHSPVRIC